MKLKPSELGPPNFVDITDISPIPVKCERVRGGIFHSREDEVVLEVDNKTGDVRLRKQN